MKRTPLIELLRDRGAPRLRLAGIHEAPLVAGTMGSGGFVPARTAQHRD
jgi:hypothetical protein